MSSCTEFVMELYEHRAPLLWNMYSQYDPDVEPRDAYANRTSLLTDYLERNVGAAYALVGLAPGYAGARFSGEPFNDELHVFQRTGVRLSKRLTPWREETSTVVQTSLSRLGLQDSVVSWNALPFHPYNEGRPLSNRTPTWNEVRTHGLPWLGRFLATVKPGMVIPVGRIAERAVLELTKITPGLMVPMAKYVRHPAHGGNALFFRGLLTATGAYRAEEVVVRTGSGQDSQG